MARLSLFCTRHPKLACLALPGWVALRESQALRLDDAVDLPILPALVSIVAADRERAGSDVGLAAEPVRTR